MAIRVYNTISRKKEEFVPNDKERVGIYVCGVTPYSQTHIGHARPSVVWDVIKKFLRYQGYQVFHVQNFTDVDDKIIAKSLEEQVPALELSARYSKDYLESMDALGVARADIYPKVSEHIPEIVELIGNLVNKGHAYAVDGNVFYDVESFKNYGKLSNQRLEDLYTGTRFEVDPSKKNPMDFALWKKAKPGEPAWDSPWGEGRPGWHIECSAMSHKYLGPAFDFHGGGSDLIFPHHENEIAQSEAATDTDLARYWVHNGMLNLKAEKMSKSIGNIVTIKDVLAKFPRELFRFYILSNHYRSELEYHDEKLEEVSKGWRRLNHCVNNLAGIVKDPPTTKPELTGDELKLWEKIQAAKEEFVTAMEDDFNTALAIGVLFDLMRHINGYLASYEPSLAGEYVLHQAYLVFAEFGSDILGVIQVDQQKDQGLVDPLMELLIELRQELRAQKNYQLADTIRDKLQVMGVVLEDTPQGTRWKLQ